MNYEMIVATNKEGIIGINNSIPWYIPEDLQYFKKITENHIIVLGRKTFESLPNILKNRIHLILTKNSLFGDKYNNQENIFVCTSIVQANNILNDLIEKTGKKVFIIGGSEIYTLFYEYCKVFHITQVHYKITTNPKDNIISIPYKAEYFINNLNFALLYNSGINCSKNNGIMFQHYKFETIAINNEL